MGLHCKFFVGYLQTIGTSLALDEIHYLPCCLDKPKTTPPAEPQEAQPDKGTSGKEQPQAEAKEEKVESEEGEEGAEQEEEAKEEGGGAGKHKKKAAGKPAAASPKGGVKKRNKVKEQAEVQEEQSNAGETESGADEGWSKVSGRKKVSIVTVEGLFLDFIISLGVCRGKGHSVSVGREHSTCVCIAYIRKHL